MQKTLHLLGSCTENFPLIQISSILSVNFTSLWHRCQRVFWWTSCTSARHAGSFDCLMTSLILDYNGQWQKALCILAVLQSSEPNPQRNKKNWKMYAIKQIKICAEYRDMLPRPRLDLSDTPGLWPIGLSPGSWQTSLAWVAVPVFCTDLNLLMNLCCVLGHNSLSGKILTSKSLKVLKPRYWML